MYIIKLYVIYYYEHFFIYGQKKIGWGKSSEQKQFQQYSCPFSSPTLSLSYHPSLSPFLLPHSSSSFHVCPYYLITTLFNSKPGSIPYFACQALNPLPPYFFLIRKGRIVCLFDSYLQILKRNENMCFFLHFPFFALPSLFLHWPSFSFYLSLSLLPLDLDLNKAFSSARAPPPVIGRILLGVWPYLIFTVFYHILQGAFLGTCTLAVVPFLAGCGSCWHAAPHVSR